MFQPHCSSSKWHWIFMKLSLSIINVLSRFDHLGWSKWLLQLLYQSCSCLQRKICWIHCLSIFWFLAISLQIFLINDFCHIPLWSIIVCRSDLQQQLFARMKTNKARQWWAVFSFIETSSFVLMQSSTCCRELVIIELNNRKNKISCPHSLCQPEFSTFQHIVSTMRDNNPPWHYYWWLKLFYIWTLGTMLWSESPVTSAKSLRCVWHVWLVTSTTC